MLVLFMLVNILSNITSMRSWGGWVGSYNVRNIYLIIRYSAWDPGSVEMVECGGSVAVEVISRRVLLDGGLLPYLQLDEHRLAFSMLLIDFKKFIFQKSIHSEFEIYGCLI